MKVVAYRNCRNGYRSKGKEKSNPNFVWTIKSNQIWLRILAKVMILDIKMPCSQIGRRSERGYW